MPKALQKILSISVLVVGTDEMVENHQEEEDDANEVAEHGKLDIRDHGEIGRRVLGII